MRLLSFKDSRTYQIEIDGIKHSFQLEERLEQDGEWKLYITLNRQTILEHYRLQKSFRFDSQVDTKVNPAIWFVEDMNLGHQPGTHESSIPDWGSKWVGSVQVYDDTDIDEVVLIQIGFYMNKEKVSHGS